MSHVIKHFIVAALIPICLLFLFKSGWMLVVLKNLPFIDDVIQVVSNFWGGNSWNGALSAVFSALGKSFKEEIAKTIVTLLVFSIIDKITHSCLYIGKHEEATAASRVISEGLEVLVANFFSLVITSLLVETINPLLPDFSNLLSLLLLGVSLPLAAGLAFLVCKILSRSFSDLIKYIVINILCVSGFKMILIEASIVFLYLVLNAPGVADTIATVLLVIASIACMMGSVFIAHRPKH